MISGLITLTSGLLAIGYMTYRYLPAWQGTAPGMGQDRSRRWRVARWLDGERSQVEQSPKTAQMKQSQQTSSTVDASIRFGLRTSGLSLGLATAGLLLPSPLSYASLPTLICMGVPPAQEAYDTLRNEGRAGRALAETAALAVCLGGGYLWAGSLGFSLYYLGRTILSRNQEHAGSHNPHPPRPTTAHLTREDSTIDVPVSSLRRGDRIRIESGEIVPVDGIITEGAAWLKAAALSQDAAEVWKETGHRVYAMDIVVVGSLCLLVQHAGEASSHPPSAHQSLEE